MSDSTRDTTTPAAILWFTVAPNGCIYVVDELYRGGLPVADHARDIRARNAGRTVVRYYADPQHAFSRTAQSPKSIASQLKDCGLTFVPWPRTGGSEETMVEAVRKRLTTDRLKVFATCVNTIREFQSWSYKRSPSGELPPGEDKFEDKDNHAMDVREGVDRDEPEGQGGGSDGRMIYFPGNNSIIWRLKRDGYPVGMMMSPDGIRRPFRDDLQLAYALDTGLYHKGNDLLDSPQTMSRL
jgi:hypothetical protein